MNDQPEQTPVESTPEEPTLAVAVPKNERVIVRSHSPILYWWPVWFLAGLFWLLQATLFSENENAIAIMGLTFVSALLFVIFSTTVRLRGANSVIFILVIVIIAILLAMANLSAAISAFIGGLNIRMSDEFYFVIFAAVLGLSIVMFAVFDRIKYWKVVPGQITESVMWGARENVLGGSNSRCHYKSDDFLRHRVLGLFLVGDLEITNGTDRVEVHNVFMAKAKSKRINELIVMRPIT